MQVGDKVKIVAEGSRGTQYMIGREGTVLQVHEEGTEYPVLVDIDLHPQWSSHMAYFNHDNLEVVCN